MPADIASVLAASAWVLRVERTESESAELPRWRHAALEDLLGRSPDERPDFRRWLPDENAVVAANAAIAAARSGDREVADSLHSAVQNPSLKLAQRQAAAESLSLCAPVAATAALAVLLDQYGSFRPPQGLANYLPKLHAELLRAAARVNPRQSLPRLFAALESPADEVRLAALEAWPRDASAQVPDEIVRMVQDRDSAVRRAALQLLALHEHPDVLLAATQAARDQDLQVRLAAIAALGTIDDPQAAGELQRLLDHPAEKIRAAAVAALAESGAHEALLAAAEDDSWHVRYQVALSLRSERSSKNSESASAREAAGRPTSEMQQAATRLVADNSSKVALAAIAGLDSWPLPEAGRVLLAALGSSNQRVRESAAESLHKRWPAAKRFPADAARADREAALKWLEQRFARHVQPTEQSAPPEKAAPVKHDEPFAASTETNEPTLPAREVLYHIGVLRDPERAPAEKGESRQALLQAGGELVKLLEPVALELKQPLPEEVYAELLPAVDPAFGHLAALASEHRPARRAAARALKEGEHPLAELALQRLVHLAAAEKDPLVWRHLLDALAPDPREPAARLHYMALTHTDPELRRRACRYLGAHPHPRRTEALLEQVDDENPAVVLQAVEALGNCEQLENPLPLLRLLASRDKQLVLASAKTLARQGHTSGHDALERLAYDPDSRLRRQAAAAMGEIAHPRFAGTLIKLLDDQLGIRQTALKSLPQVAGKDVAATGEEERPAMAERIRRWKSWHAREVRQSE